MGCRSGPRDPDAVAVALGHEEDGGFDILRIAVPGIVDAQDLSVRLGGESILPKAVAVEADSLLSIVLPETVLLDSVGVEFTARVLHNSAVFAVDLGSSQRPGIWQAVETVERRSHTVFLPELVQPVSKFAFRPKRERDSRGQGS